MVHSLLKLAKQMLGNRLYKDIRARFLFRGLKSLHPLYPDTPFAMDWDKYTVPDNGKDQPVRAVYIVSPSQRSGTNFLNNMLNQHPDIIFPTGPDLPGEQSLFTYAELLKTYAYNTVSTWNKWVEGGEPALVAHSKGLVSAMGAGILDYFSVYAKPGNILLFKTPDTGHLEDFFHVFPQVKVIILVRDGRDTVESFIKSWGGAFTFRKICIRWSQRVNIIWDFIEKSRKSGFSDMVYLVRYDYLNEYAVPELTNLLKFIGVDEKKYPWEQLHNIPVVGSSSVRDTGSEVHWKPIKKTDKIKLKHKWDHWNKYKKDVFKETAGENLIKLGFAQDNDW